MRWFKRQTTFTKLLLGFGLMAFLVGFVGYLGIQALSVVSNLNGQLYRKHALPLAHLRAANTHLLQRARMVRNVVLDTVFHDPETVKNWVEKREQFGVQFNREYSAYREAVGLNEGEGETAAMDRLVRQLDVKEQEVIALALAGKPQEANGTLWTVRTISGEIDRQIDLISAHQFADMRIANEEASRIFRETSYLIGGIAVLAALFAIAIGIWIARMIARPLVSLSEELARVGIGGPTADAELQSGDEVTQVIECTRQMVARLQRIVAQANDGQAAGSPTAVTGSVDFLETLAQEITDRKRAVAELAQRDEQLRQSHKLQAVGSLAGGIAHEFNNLLQAIRGYTRYGMEGLSSDDHRYKDLEQVIKAADRAAALTSQLLGFSRRQVLEHVNFDPRELVTDLVKMIRPLIGEHIDLEVSLATDVRSLYADRDLLEQMLLNLCINSRDAMPDGGRLVLKAQHADLSERYCKLHPTVKPGSYVVFSVADTGCGISPEVKERIFEPFFTTKEVGKGTGLGLAMVYGAVQQHGGIINVYSEPNIGTTFKIYLPIVAGLDSVTDERPADPAAGGQETILIAEDEPMVRDLAVRILTRAGYSVLVASDGAEALALFEANTDVVSLALLDAVMPKLTGRQVYDRIKLRQSSLPVVFCSGYDPETGQVGLLMDQGVRSVQKPYDPDVLLRAVREALDARHLLEASACTA